MKNLNNELLYKNLIKKRDETLGKLKDKMSNYILGGGTALSVFYFQHRDSFDLDFFAKEAVFLPREMEQIISALFLSFNIIVDPNLKKTGQLKGKEVYIRYNLPVSENLGCPDEDLKYLKIEFICDYYRDIVPNEKTVNGIRIMSLENIYLRKIYTVFGTLPERDDTGRTRFIGGRQEAKDFFDLFYLSKFFMPLSKFISQYCDLNEKQSAILWRNSYSRLEMEEGLRQIRTVQTIDYREMRIHFDSEIEKIIRSLI